MTERPRVLCVEDDDGLRSLMLDIALDSGFEASAAATAEAALVCAADTRVDVLVTDVLLPAMSGIDLMTRMRSLHPGLSVIVISGQATVDMAVTAMKRGALDFLTKPFSPQGLRTLLRLAAARSPAVGAAVDAPAPPILGNSVAMREVLDQIDRIAPFSTSVLIAGETGTGKELVAQRLHAHSPRASKSFVALNCAAVPEQLLEDELFGHVRGAFTGASRARAGLFEVADGGTLFLDEIAEMSLGMQTKLLRVLEDGEVHALGSERPRRVDVRVIGATHRDLEERVAAGQFRQDLLYRLNVIRLEVPSLRQRRGDIPLLVRHFLGKHAGGRSVRISREAVDRLAAFSWPGNIRQLENEIRRALVLADEVIEPGHLSPDVAAGGAGRVRSENELDLRARVDELEHALVEKALAKTAGNQTRAAELLGLSRFGLQKMMKRLGVGQASKPGRRTPAGLVRPR